MQLIKYPKQCISCEQKSIHTVLSSKYIVFDKKSIPIVAYTENTTINTT